MSVDIFKFRKDAGDSVTQEDLDAINATNAQQDADIDALQANDAQQDADIDALQANDAVQDADIDALQAASNGQDAAIDFLNNQPGFRAVASPGSALTSNGATQTLVYDTVQYIDDVFDYTNGILTYSGPPERFHVSWALAYQGSVIPILQSIGSAQGGVLRGDGTLLSLDTQLTQINLTTQPLMLKGAFDIELNTNDTLAVNYEINTSAVGVIVTILNLLGLGGSSQEVTHFSVHMI